LDLNNLQLQVGAEHPTLTEELEYVMFSVMIKQMTSPINPFRYTMRTIEAFV